MANDVNLNRRFLEAGDIEAFTLVFQKYYPIVCAHVGRMMRNHPDPAVDADDITSETFAKAFTKRKEIREPEKFLGWLLSTTRNLTIAEVRKSETRMKHLAIESLDNLSISERDTLFASTLLKLDFPKV